MLVAVAGSTARAFPTSGHLKYSGAAPELIDCRLSISEGLAG